MAVPETEGEKERDGKEDRVRLGTRSFSRPSRARTYKASSLARIFDSEVARREGVRREDREARGERLYFR